MEDPSPLKVGCSPGQESWCILFLIKYRAYLPNSQTLQWSLKRSKLLPQEYAGFSLDFSPTYFAFVCLFCLSCGTTFSSMGSRMYNYRVRCYSSVLSCPLSCPVLISDGIIALLPVSAGLFGVWLCQRLPQWQASACLSLTFHPIQPCVIISSMKTDIHLVQAKYWTCVFVWASNKIGQRTKILRMCTQKGVRMKVYFPVFIFIIVNDQCSTRNILVDGVQLEIENQVH